MGTLLWPTDKILLFIFIVTAIIDIGLQASLRELAAELLNKSFVIRVLAVNFVLVPALGIALVKLLPMSPDAEVGVLLLSVAPGGLTAINFTRQLCAKIESAAALLFLLTLSGIVLTPILAELLLQSAVSVQMHYAKVIKVIVVYVALPLIAGLSLNKSVPKIAKALQKPISIISALAFVAFAIATTSQKSSALKAIAGGGTLIALAVLTIGAMTLGWFFAGSDPEAQRLMSVNSGMRSLAISLAIATRSLPETDTNLTIIASAAVSIPIVFVFTLYQKRKAKRQPAERAVSAA